MRLSIVFTSAASRRNWKTSRSARMWAALVVPVNSRCRNGRQLAKNGPRFTGRAWRDHSRWRRAAGRKDEIDPIRHLIVAATGWGLNSDKNAICLNVTPKQNAGKTLNKLTVKYVPVDGFWSNSVYNAKGNYEPNRENDVGSTKPGGSSRRVDSLNK